MTKLTLVWNKAVMKRPLLELRAGQKVLVTSFPFKHKSVARTWFIFNGKVSYQVTEEFGGRGLCQLLVTNGGLYPDQEAATEKFRPFFNRWKASKFPKKSQKRPDSPMRAPKA